MTNTSMINVFLGSKMKKYIRIKYNLKKKLTKVKSINIIMLIAYISIICLIYNIWKHKKKKSTSHRIFL